MAAEISFYAGLTPVDMATSGLGFYGASFGNSVQVGQYQDSTYITSSDGSTEGPQANNAKYITASGVQINGSNTVHPSSLAVASGTVNIRFTYDNAVQTQNGEFRIYDRTSINNGATGVITQACQLVNGGSGVNNNGEAVASHSGWVAPSGSGTTVTLLSSPGSGGLSPSGTGTTDTRHDWYFCLSATPTSIGAKTAYGMYVQLEYL